MNGMKYCVASVSSALSVTTDATTTATAATGCTRRHANGSV